MQKDKHRNDMAEVKNTGNNLIT